MAKLDTKALTDEMLAAAAKALKGHWKDARPFAQAEMEKLAITAVQIELGSETGEITAAQAKILLKMQANASQAVLTSLQTIGMIAAQDAINAALNVLVAAVNKAAGVAVL